jgi:hypothetical protein
VYMVNAARSITACLLVVLLIVCEKKDKAGESGSAPDKQDSISETDATKTSRKVRLMWSPNTEPDILGYRIYRRGRPFTADSSLPWTSWIVLTENVGVAETIHVDGLVEIDYEYEYKITAFDTLCNESGFSNVTHAHVQ